MTWHKKLRLSSSKIKNKGLIHFCEAYTPHTLSTAMASVGDATFRGLLHKAYSRGNFHLQPVKRLTTHASC